MESFQSSAEASLFQECMELPPDSRKKTLEAKCSDNPALINRLLKLLRTYEKVGDFMESPPGIDSDEAVPTNGKPGERIGRYRLRELIAEGAWGSVWLAEQIEDIERRVALKILKPGMDTHEFLARFEAERRMLSMMNHPGIAQVLDAGATPTGRPYLVMELIKGRPLLEYAEQERLSLEERVELFIRVCQAVHHAHRKGVVHRDLKPSNILVSEHDDRPQPKIIDFGIAKSAHSHLSDKTVYTQFHTFLGTPVYSSPEQLDTGGREVDQRSDIYSLGAILYELLCGRKAFNGELSQLSIEDMKALVRDTDPNRPSRRFAALPTGEKGEIARLRRELSSKLESKLRGELDWIVMKCLEKDRSRRYDSARALASDLHCFLKNQPVSAAAPSPAYRIQKFIKRNRPPYAIWLELVAGLCALLAFVSLLRPSTISETTSGDESLAVLPFENLSPDPKHAYFADAMHDEILANLAHISDLFLIGSRSVHHYRDTEKTFREIGDELKVSHVLEGSVYRENDRVGITVKLIDAQTEQQTWFVSYNRSADDLFTLRSAVAKDIADQLQVFLSPKEIEEVERLPTQSLEAYDYFLKSQDVPRDIGTKLLEKAVALDPDYLDAWADLAWNRLISWRFRHHRNNPELLASAYDALNQMRRLAPDSKLTISREGTFAYHVEDDLEKVLTLQLRAKSLGFHGNAGMRYMQLGHLEQARYEYEAGLLSDPLNRAMIRQLFWVYAYSGMWDEAQFLLEGYKEKSEVEGGLQWKTYLLALLDYLKNGGLEKYLPSRLAWSGNYDELQIKLWKSLVSRDFPSALNHLEDIDFYWFQLIGNPAPNRFEGMGFKPLELLSALIWFELGDQEKCLEQVEKAKAFFASIDTPEAQNIPPDSASLLAICYALEGNRERMESLMSLVREKTNTENWQFREQAYTELHLAICHLVLGENDQAIEILEAASKMKSMIFVNRELDIWFIFDRLHGDPRFEALLKN